MADTKISALTAVGTAVPGSDEFAVNQSGVSKKVKVSQYAGIQGGFAALDSGILVPRAYLPQIAGLLHNMTAAVAPTVNEDSGDGYGIGSRWLDTTADIEYVCLDATVGAAVWRGTSYDPGAWATFSPTLTAVTTNPTLGSGSSSVGRYCQVGKLVTALIRITFGTSGVNPGSGEYRVALPVTARDADQAIGCAYGFDSSAGTFVVWASSDVLTTTFRFHRDGASTVGHNAPWTWAASDQIRAVLTYEAA